MRSLLVAVQFLTRLPVPVGNVTEKEIGRSALYFPLVGLLVGGILLGAYLLTSLAFPLLLARVLTLIVLILVSGAFHLDGLADTIDGLYGGRDREDALRIMKDPHIGAMGVIAIGSVLLLKAAALASLPEAFFRGALVAMPVVGHCAMVAVLAWPYARSSGLGKVFADHRLTRDGVFAAVIATSVSFGTLKFAGAGALFGALLSGAVLLGFVWKKIRGVTGDVCGAINEFAETGFLITLSALAPVSFAPVERGLPEIFWRWHL
jgi:adenosylcobinamide-GDP ribazoletransferase